jgi:hypothetical protein
LSWCPAGKGIVVVGSDISCITWDALWSSTQKACHKLMHLDNHIHGSAWSIRTFTMGEGTSAIACSSAGTVCMSEMEPHNLDRRARNRKPPFSALLFSIADVHQSPDRTSVYACDQLAVQPDFNAKTPYIPPQNRSIMALSVGPVDAFRSQKHGREECAQGCLVAYGGALGLVRCHIYNSLR